MLQLTPQSRIFLATEPVDFRKGIDGLGAVCRQRLGAKPSGGGGLCLPKPIGHGHQTPALRWTRLLAMHEATLSRALYLVAKERRRTSPPIRSRIGHFNLEW